MYILHEGEGTWGGTSIHPENPQRRDVFQGRKKGHLVMQFDAGENPGKIPSPSHLYVVNAKRTQEYGHFTATSRGTSLQDSLPSF